MSCNQLEEAAETFRRELTFYANKHMPVKTKVIKATLKPFITEETKNLIKEKQAALNKHKTSKDPADLTEYKRLTKLVQKAVANDRTKNLTEDLQTASTLKAAWRQAKTIMGQGNNTAPKNIEINGNLTSNQTIVAEAFSAHQKTKIENLRKQAPSKPTTHPAQRLKTWLSQRQNPPPEFNYRPVTSNKVFKLLQRLKSGRSLPKDEIDAKTIKDAAAVLAPAIKRIINLSLQEGHFATNFLLCPMWIGRAWHIQLRLKACYG